MTANRIFVMLAAMPPNEPVAYFQTSEEGETQLWHSRFAHLSFKGLRTLYYKKMVEGLPSLKAPTKVCTDCLARETTQGQHSEENPLDSLIQATTCSFGHLWTYESRIQQRKEVPNHFH
ncbi:Integrase catalytic domain-containing protein [Abeliophyllum distichum]|uniref:Integrase catalytic domain-containing protein n=1 Tax=Abeliophyllum distichum TaxID=126358 RepID=A0ABD1PD21_9LAMI